MTRLALIFGIVITAGLSACAPATQPGPVAPVAADNGQPVMQAALGALQQAQTELNAATSDKGGFRVQALAAVQQAIDHVNAGMQYAAAHASEAGEAEGAAEGQPVDTDVPGAEHQPHMAQAIVDLREARKQLHDAKHDKGGHRKQALAAIQQAIDAVKQGIAFADTH